MVVIVIAVLIRDDAIFKWNIIFVMGYVHSRRTEVSTRDEGLGGELFSSCIADRSFAK